MTTETIQKLNTITDTRAAGVAAADVARAEALATVNREFVAAIKPLIDSKQATVNEIADIVCLDRTRVYQIIRTYV